MNRLKKSLSLKTTLAAMMLLAQVPCLAAGSSSGSDAWKNPLAMTAGICSGFVVGTPVAMARRFVHDEKQGARGIAGETDNKLLLVPAGVIWLPFATLTAFCEGPVYAFRNSYMADKPFSKEQFSLGDMPEYDSSEILKNSD